MALAAAAAAAAVDYAATITFSAASIYYRVACRH